MQSGLDWAVVYRGMAVIFVLLAVLMAFAALPSVQPETTEQDETRERLSANPAYWLSFFALFLYLGVELGVSNWVAEYFVVLIAPGSTTLTLMPNVPSSYQSPSDNPSTANFEEL